MKVTLEKTYPMPASADATWKLLQQIEAVAGCMPGARITEKIDATHYKGTLAVKLGPANLSFKGDIEVLGLDAATRTLRLAGKGTDSTGGSGASMDLTARVVALDDETSELVGTSEVSMSGKAAAFGNRMMSSVAEQVLKQFVTRFTDEVRLVQGRMPKPVAPPAAAAAVPAATPAPAAVVPEMPVSALPPTAEGVSAGPVHAEPAKPLNGLGLLWGLVTDWLRGLFGRRR